MVTNRNSHTTSTKCQYHAAASKPKWCVVVKWYLIKRIKQTVKNNVPMITWKPWNPVAIKNVEPYIPSAILKAASSYSKTCNAVKIKAKKTVKIKP